MKLKYMYQFITLQQNFKIVYIQARINQRNSLKYQINLLHFHLESLASYGALQLCAIKAGVSQGIRIGSIFNHAMPYHESTSKQFSCKQLFTILSHVFWYLQSISQIRTSLTYSQTRLKRTLRDHQKMFVIIVIVITEFDCNYSFSSKGIIFRL